MTDFFRFPHPPHLAWLAAGEPRNDKVLSLAEAQTLLAGEVVVEEKLDGANLGLSLNSEGALRTQNRGQYLYEPHAGQFSRLPAWLSLHGDSLARALTPDLIFFGEWCSARHSLAYTTLPDWFLLFDVYDRSVGKFWCSKRRNNLAAKFGINTVPELFRGRTTIVKLKAMLQFQISRFRDGALEGVVIRQESAEWCETRAKLVRADFTQPITEHWRRRLIEWNRLSSNS